MKRLFWGSFLSLVFLCGLPSFAQNLKQYTIQITFPKDGNMSGICIIRMEGRDGTMSVINEFGIKVFDAIYSADKDKVKLSNVIKLLDKWYIRRIIAKDMSLVFNPDKQLPKRRTIVHGVDGTVKLTNKRFKITYYLQPIKNAVE